MAQRLCPISYGLILRVTSILTSLLYLTLINSPTISNDCHNAMAVIIFMRQDAMTAY